MTVDSFGTQNVEFNFIHNINCSGDGHKTTAKVVGPKFQTKSEISGEPTLVEEDKDTPYVTSPERISGKSLEESTECLKISKDGEIPAYLEKLIEGKRVCGDSYVPFSKPVWFDAESFHRGQLFAVAHLAGVMLSELLALIMGLLISFEGTFEPLIFTRQSDTPFKAFKRYLSTVVHVKTWFEGDIWDPSSAAHRSLKAVRRMHEVTRVAMDNCSEEELAKRTTLEGEDMNTSLESGLSTGSLEDFQRKCPLSYPSTSFADNSRQVFINQHDMAMTQVAFAANILVHPEKFGIHHASKADLEGFAHFWRTIGYVLGMEDKYNLCDGDLNTVQQCCLDIGHIWILPRMTSATREGFHMARCATEGLGFFIPSPPFEALLLYACHVHKVHTPRLYASLSFFQWFIYLYTVLMFKFVMKIPGMWTLHNWMLCFLITRAQNFSKEKLRKLKEKVY